MYEVTIKRSFPAAHALKEIGGRCEDLHGHNFTVEVSVSSNKLSEEGILIDFRVLEEWVEEILADFDHRYLNEIEYFKNSNPSSENIARQIYERVGEKARTFSLDVSRVTLWESETARVAYNGEK